MALRWWGGHSWDCFGCMLNPVVLFKDETLSEVLVFEQWLAVETWKLSNWKVLIGFDLGLKRERGWSSSAGEMIVLLIITVCLPLLFLIDFCCISILGMVWFSSLTFSWSFVSILKGSVSFFSPSLYVVLNDLWRGTRSVGGSLFKTPLNNSRYCCSRRIAGSTICRVSLR